MWEDLAFPLECAQTLTAPFPDQALGTERILCVCVCVYVCGAPSMTICMEQHQPHIHLGGSPLPKAEELPAEAELSAAFLSNQPGTDVETESRFPVPPQQAFRQHGAHTGTHQAEEVDGGFQLKVSKKPEPRFLFITKKCLRMRVREERWAQERVAQDDVPA